MALTLTLQDEYTSTGSTISVYLDLINDPTAHHCVFVGNDSGTPSMLWQDYPPQFDLREQFGDSNVDVHGAFFWCYGNTEVGQALFQCNNTGDMFAQYWLVRGALSNSPTDTTSVNNGTNTGWVNRNLVAGGGFIGFHLVDGADLTRDVETQNYTGSVSKQFNASPAGSTSSSALGVGTYYQADTPGQSGGQFGMRGTTSGSDGQGIVLACFEPGPTGVSLNRDGVAGTDLASVDGVDAGVLASVDGVNAMTRQLESGLYVSNDPKYMRKAA